MNAGRPVSAAIASMTSGVAREPVAITNTPRRASPSAPASALSSPSVAMVEGIGRPPQPLWLGENDEAKPIAPASSASRTSARISAISSARAAERVEASSPITAVRIVECCASTATLA